MAFSRCRKGQSLLEVLIAVALLAFIAGSAFVIISQSFRESLAGNQQVRARQILAEGLAAARQIRNRDYASLAPGIHGLVLSGGSWAFSGTNDLTDNAYARTVTITTVDGSQSDVTVRVAWNPMPNRSASVQASTRLTNWLAAPIPSGSHCAAGPIAGDWNHPISLGSVDIGPGNEGTDVAIKGNYVFISGVASSAGKPDLFVFDVSNPSLPVLVTSLDVGAGGINSLFLLGNNLFAASANDAREFMTFDVTDPTHPTLISSSDLPGSADGLSVMAVDTWAVVGRENDAPTNVIFYDVSHPAIPSAIASFSVPGDVTDFTTDGTYVYALSGSNKEINVFSITDPLHPSFVSSYDIPNVDGGTSIAYMDPGTLLVGANDGRLFVINASNVRDMSVRNTYDAGGTIQDISCVTGDLGFLATSNSTKEFDILNLKNLDQIVEYASFNFPQVATGAVFSNDKIYVSVRSNDALRIIAPGP